MEGRQLLMGSRAYSWSTINNRDPGVVLRIMRALLGANSAIGFLEPVSNLPYDTMKVLN
jgi:hypothetical protein